MTFHTYVTRDQAFEHLAEKGTLNGLPLWMQAGARERDADGRPAQVSEADLELVRAQLGDDIAKEGRVVPFLLSTGNRVKKDLLKLNPMGWDLDSRFRSNPVMLWAHDGGICAPSKPKIGHWVMKDPAEDGLRALGVFLPRSFDGTPSRHAEFAWEIGEIAHRFGFAVSVGFEVLEDAEAELSDQERDELGDDADRARDSVRQALWEASPVNIGADPRALTEARIRGLATDAVADVVAQVLDAGVRNPELLAAWAAARGEPTRTVVDMAPALDVKSMLAGALSQLDPPR